MVVVKSYANCYGVPPLRHNLCLSHPLCATLVAADPVHVYLSHLSLLTFCLSLLLFTECLYLAAQ